MAMPTLDLVAFHWWDYADQGYRDLLQHAVALMGPQEEDSADGTVGRAARAHRHPGRRRVRDA